MKWLRRVFTSSHFWPLLIVLIFGVLASRTLLFQRGYFNMHDDLQLMRQLQMEKCFLDGQIPCRWVPDMGYGFGFPLFNFYPPLPYLIGQGIRLFGFTFINTAKILFALSIVVSGVGMYLLAKEFFGKRGGVLASVFYIWAPYHAVDVYVRGAMNEAWALTIFPFIFWSAYRLIKEKQKTGKWLIVLAISIFALLTSHNLMVLIFGPLSALWVALWMWRENKWSRLSQLLKAGLLALGLAAFFTIPVLTENKFTQIRGQLVGYYDYTAHFVDLNQLFVSRFWGYGPSVWDVIDDGMSFQIGHIHWILSLFVGGWVLHQLLKIRSKKSKLKTIHYMLLSLFIVGWLSAFMAHTRSTFVWKLIPPLGYLQFSWRFLTIITFSFSLLAGSVALIFRNKRIGNWIIGLLTVGLLVFNWNFFVPEHGKMGNLTDEEKFSDAAWDLQQTAGIYDYLPVYAETAPKEPRKYLAEILEGEAVVSEEREGTNWAEFKIGVESELAIIRLGIFKFPGWRVFVDGEEVEVMVPEEEKWGRMWIKVGEGEHQIEVRLHNTLPRTAGNLISLVSWVGLIAFPLLKFKRGRSGRR